jgi:hypothetical protein
MSDTKNPQEKYIVRVVLSLNSTVVDARYKATCSKMLIQGETELTYIASNSKFGVKRIYKKNLMLVVSDFVNTTLQKMQYIADCLEEDLEECLEKMSLKIKEDIALISLCNKNSLTAYKSGYILEIN